MCNIKYDIEIRLCGKICYGADAPVLFCKKSRFCVGGPVAIQQRAFMHVKATGVIHIYDFLNLPTAIVWRFLFICKTEKGAL